MIYKLLIVIYYFICLLIILILQFSRQQIKSNTFNIISVKVSRELKFYIRSLWETRKGSYKVFLY